MTNFVQRMNTRLDGNAKGRSKKKRKRSGPLFEGRFKNHLVEKDSYLLELSRYIVLNPVRAHMVERPEEYRWSSYRATAGLEAAPAWLTTSWLLSQFGSDPTSARNAYRIFVDEGVGIERSPWENLRHQIFLGRTEWLERMRSWIESEDRSVEIPRTQRCIARPTLESVVEAVAEVLEITAAEIVEQRGGLARMLVAKLAFSEGLIVLRLIAAGLTLRSSGHISNLVRRCGREMRRHADLARLVNDCLARLRPAALALG